jgi:hypothetical protein
MLFKLDYVCKTEFTVFWEKNVLIVNSCKLNLHGW